jgi:raffinose/stachyose/melibiose transport system permease protein
VGLGRYTWRTFAREIVLLLIAAGFFLPLYMMVVIMFGRQDALSHPLTPPSHPTLDNFDAAWNGGSGGVTFGHSLLSSAIITVSSVVVLIVVGSLAAYVLARRTSKLSTVLYVVFVSGLILPFQLGVIPTYVAMRHLHLVGSYLGIILLEVGLLMPVTVFLYTGFIRALPREYEEAAQVDGAGLLRTYVRVVFPLLAPITGTAAVIAGVAIWNDFFNPLIFLSGTRNLPLPVLVYNFAGENGADWNLIFAGIVVSLLPVTIFYLIAQRQLMRGFSGGIRG